MKGLIPEIRKIAEKIVRDEMNRKKLSMFLRELESETNLLKKLQPNENTNSRVVGVDGGISKKSLHGLDCMLIRAAAACFHYENSKVKKVEYFPSRMPVPAPIITEAMSDLDWAYFSAISRQKLEVETARKCIEKFKPSILMMDGSIVPHYSTRPSKNSPAYKTYSGMLEEYKRLFMECERADVNVTGVVEDSRGRTFCNFIKSHILSQISHKTVPELEKLLDKTRDTNLLFLFMEKGERTRVFNYSSSPDEHPILKDLGDI